MKAMLRLFASSFFLSFHQSVCLLHFLSISLSFLLSHFLSPCRFLKMYYKYFLIRINFVCLSIRREDFYAALLYMPFQLSLSSAAVKFIFTSSLPFMTWKGNFARFWQKLGQTSLDGTLFCYICSVYLHEIHMVQEKCWICCCYL